ncbi:MAG: DUF2520 domain-containing protein [Mediterranea sp.]|jgi:predicted short-subunit dehydrogenase-like oxidoreductase (DUF2520 family)|nr:DUF2520 domain-containing protein [Mediterranea sp.]
MATTTPPAEKKTRKRSIEDTQIVLVGAGNLATNLAVALYRKGFRVAQVYSRTEEAAATLAKKVEADYTTDLSELSTRGQLYIVALKDETWPDLLPRIVAGKNDALMVHTAGSLPMSVWENNATRYGVIYPLQTFSKGREVDFREIPIFVEANSPDDTALLRAIASTLSAKVGEASSDQRKCLHLAAVFISNFTNHMYALAAELLHKCDLPFDVMLPLIDETARKVHDLPPHDAQTGPAVRRDRQVIDSHLAMLADDPALHDLYQLLTQSIHEHH